jgi:hypothetical protein
MFRCAFRSKGYWVLSEGIGGGPNVVLAGSLRAASGTWAADPYPLEVGVVSLHEVLWVTRFVVFFAVFGGEDAEELEGGALCYVAFL